MYHFPQPHRLHGATRWSPSELLEWEHAQGLDLSPPTGMMSVRQVASRYSVSVATIWRWAQKARTGVAA